MHALNSTMTVIVAHGLLGPFDELAPFVLVFAASAGLYVRPLVALVRQRLGRGPRPH